MTATESRLKPADTEFFAREIDAFLPDRVFDAHTHLWKREFIPWQVEGAPADIGYVEYQQLMRDLHPHRRVGGRRGVTQAVQHANLPRQQQKRL